jgi:hypothetical protein
MAGGISQYLLVLQQANTSCELNLLVLLPCLSQTLGYLAKVIANPSLSSPFCVRNERCSILHVVSFLAPRFPLGTIVDDISCANVKVTGSGTSLGNATVKFPGAYTPTDPYVTPHEGLNICANQKQWDQAQHIQRHDSQ